MRRSHLIQALLVTASLLGAGSADSAVRAWVDGNAATSDAGIELNLEHDGQTSADPDLAPLKQDFDVLGSNTSSRIQIVNGHATSSVRIAIALSPKHAGPLTIPALAWGNEKSDPIPLTVGGGAAPGHDTQQAGGGRIFLRTAITSPHPYVQAGVDLTVRLYAATPLYHASLDFPAGNDVLVQQIGTDKKESVVENGRRYQVIERHYELFPQRSGALSIPGPVLDAQVPDQDQADPLASFRDFFGNLPLNAFGDTKPIRVHADDIALTVLPRPSDAGDGYWLPTQNLSLEAHWHPDQGQPSAGDPVTVDLHLQARGLTAAQLPDLSTLLKLPPGIKAYPDQAVLKNDTDGNALIGTRDQSIALIADRAGEVTVPALALQWWDTHTNQRREVTVPAHTITFAPGARPTVQSAPQTQPTVTAHPQPQSQSQIDASLPPATARSTPTPVWFWCCVILGALWVGTLIAWYFSRRRPAPAAPPSDMQRHASAAAARRQFRDACTRNDARTARASLLAWLHFSSPPARVSNLQALARQVADTPLEGLLRELDRACYVGLPWVGAPLREALQDLPAVDSRPARQNDELLPLYK